MGRALKREAELALSARDFILGKITRDELCAAALAYASAVWHNRESRAKWRVKEKAKLLRLG